MEEMLEAVQELGLVMQWFYNEKTDAFEIKFLRKFDERKCFFTKLLPMPYLMDGFLQKYFLRNLAEEIRRKLSDEACRRLIRENGG